LLKIPRCEIGIPVRVEIQNIESPVIEKESKFEVEVLNNEVSLSFLRSDYEERVNGLEESQVSPFQIKLHPRSLSVDKSLTIMGQFLGMRPSRYTKLNCHDRGLSGYTLCVKFMKESQDGGIVKGVQSVNIYGLALCDEGYELRSGHFFCYPRSKSER
ncbi:MAG: hypothetical protein KDD50_16160, partial [Bdellovibrionales bacterium]|nr:hypothetical protein [Bdellovibrionales bacterium]